MLHTGSPVTGQIVAAEQLERSTQDMQWIEPASKCVAPQDFAARAKPGKVDLTFTPTPLAEFALLRADAGSGQFGEIGRATGGVYVDFTPVSGRSYDYALDTLCRDKSVLHGTPLRVSVPTSDRGRGSPPASGGAPGAGEAAAPAPPAGPPACGLLGIEAPLACWLVRAGRRRSARGAQASASSA